MLGRRASRLAPPRHRRGAWLGIPRPRAPPPPPLAARIRALTAHFVARTVTLAHYPCGAMGTSRPTAITPAWYALASRRRAASPAPRCRAHCPCPVAVGRDVPIAPPRHRRGAWLGIRAPLACAPLRAPLRTRITRAARWGHRALPPLHPRNSPRPSCPVAVRTARTPLR